jgi:BolA protein
MDGVERESGEARAVRIESTLRAALAPAHLSVRDESDRHRGHAGAASGGGHFRVTIVSAAFEGKTRLERHRMLHDALGDAFGAEIHALAVRAFTPEEWERKAGGG